MLRRDDTVCVMVDFQVRLLAAIHGSDAIVANAIKLARGMRALGMPIEWTEQNPRGLGPTVPELAELLPGEPIVKLSFSCCREPSFAEVIARLDRNQIVLAGIETHVCVWQTASHLLAAGREVHIVADAVSSRTPQNRDIGIERARDAGAAITSVETALFELLGVAEGPTFKEILKIVK